MTADDRRQIFHQATHSETGALASCSGVTDSLLVTVTAPTSAVTVSPSPAHNQTPENASAARIIRVARIHEALRIAGV